MSRKRKSNETVRLYIPRPSEPASLRDLVRDAVHDALVARLRVAAEREGEDLALGLLKDDAFRQEFLTLARDAARAAVEALRDPKVRR